MSELIGSRLVVPGQARGFGILKYVGSIEGKTGTFGGVELQGPTASSRGKNSGAVDGIQYFEVSQPMTGLFLPWDRLRAVNPKLPLLELSRASSVVSRSSDVSHSPTPPNRRGLRLNSIGRTDSLSRTTTNGRDSPHLGSLSINIPKRSVASRDFARPPSTALSIVGSRNSLGDLFERTRQAQLHDLAALQSELTTSKFALDASTRELQEKNAILLELQRTVDELSPLLGDYENSLSEKDKKLKKQRQEYDRAREEWRQSLDLMLSAQQQAESLYEQQIEDLKEELTKLSVNGFQSEADPGVAKMQSRLDETLTENARLKLQLQLQLSQTTPNEVDELEHIELLEKKIYMLTQDVSSIEIVLEESQKKIKGKDARIAELEIALDDLKDENILALLKGVDALSVDGWGAQEAQLKKQIEDLERQVAEHKGKENEIPKLTDSGEVAKLEAELLSSKGQVEAQLKKIGELEESLLAAASREQELKDSIESATSKEQELEKTIQDAFAREEKLLAISSNEDAPLLKTIEDLKHELKMRPSFDELTELQMALDDVERLHTNEVYLKEKELTALKEENVKLRHEVDILKIRIAECDTEIPLKTPVNNSPIKNGTSSGSASLPDPEVWAKNDSLPIYSPQTRFDPSSGRNDWCGLCERDGHNSLNCPYENDIF